MKNLPEKERLEAIIQEENKRINKSELDNYIKNNAVSGYIALVTGKNRIDVLNLMKNSSTFEEFQKSTNFYPDLSPKEINLIIESLNKIRKSCSKEEFNT
mgnify:CR=1 FL=1